MMIIALSIAVVIIFVALYMQKESMNNLIDRIEDLENKLENESPYESDNIS